MMIKPSATIKHCKQGAINNSGQFLINGSLYGKAICKTGSKRGIVMSITAKDLEKLARKYTDAWNSKSAENVASHYAADGQIIINRGDPWKGRAKVTEMAAGFYADVPDLHLTCNDVRGAGSHAVFVWTFTGHDAKTGNPLKIRGWEEWELGDDLKVITSLGWFDAEEYAKQVEIRI